MITNSLTGQTNALTDQAAQSADNAIKSTQSLANGAFDSLSGTVKDIRDQAAPMVNRATEQADTRNWQSLPNCIFYSRIPLQSGINTCTITLHNPAGESEKKILVLEGSGSLQFASVYTMK